MNYPGGIKNKNVSKNINYANRGMSLEEDINISNNYYIEKEIAYIYKKPTPIKVTKINYNLKKITEAYFESPSTTDYNGIYRGYYIDFDVKETKNKTSFNMNNIPNHQLQHIENVIKSKGIAFLIIRFTTLNKTYLLKGEDLIKNKHLKSIPIKVIEDKGYLLTGNYILRLDYLKVVDQILEEL